MNEKVFEKLKEDCPARTHNMCNSFAWVACKQGNCHIIYWIEAISKRVLNSGYEVKDFTG